ncbi:MAG: ABC transporter substrate-binding protein [Deltaproteobacteria bacterium]|nr:ABC transporter substrate-binding protein [Deltaproteobacteria bacterium]
MTTFENRWLRALSLAVFFVSVSPSSKLQAQPVNVEAAKKEGRVFVYATVPPQAMEGLNKGFEKRYGIKVEYWRGSATSVADRALTEWRAGRPGFDVVEGNPGLQVILKREGAFARYTPPSSEKFPEQFKEKDGLMTAWRVTPLSILYNTDLVKPADLPKTLDDLLDPKWKNKISIPDPSSHTTTAQFFWNLQRFKGGKWLDFVKALAKQQPHLVESFAPVPNVIIRGEALVGIAYIKYVKQYKGPIGYVVLDRHFADPYYMSLGAKAANANAGKLYMEYVCSVDGQKATAEEGEFVLYPGIYPPIKDAEKVSPTIVFMDNPTEEEFKKLRAEFRQIFFAK